MTSEEEDDKQRYSFVLSGTLNELFNKLLNLPEYAGKTDLFRDMIRVFAKEKGLI